MTEIRHITPREQALERENARLVDKTERQSATIHVQAVAIQSMTAEIEGWKADQRENIAITVKQQAEINALKADAERLNWLESSKTIHGFCHVQWGDYRYYCHQLLGFPTVREVIDNAMKEQS